MDPDAEVEFRYVVDEDNHLCGVISSDLLNGETPDASTLDSLSIAEHLSINAETPLHEVLETVADSHYPLPVIDAEGGYRGFISHKGLLQTLSRR